MIESEFEESKFIEFPNPEIVENDSQKNNYGYEIEKGIFNTRNRTEVFSMLFDELEKEGLSKSVCLNEIYINGILSVLKAQIFACIIDREWSADQSEEWQLIKQSVLAFDNLVKQKLNGVLQLLFTIPGNCGSTLVSNFEHCENLETFYTRIPINTDAVCPITGCLLKAGQSVHAFRHFDNVSVLISSKTMEGIECIPVEIIQLLWAFKNTKKASISIATTVANRLNLTQSSSVLQKIEKAGETTELRNFLLTQTLLLSSIDTIFNFALSTKEARTPNCSPTLSFTMKALSKTLDNKPEQLWTHGHPNQYGRTKSTSETQKKNPHKRQKNY